MKRIFTLTNLPKVFALTAFTLLFKISVTTFAQTGAAINSTGSAADPSAILDVSSTSAGLLIPRMTTLERNAISNPAEGLQIFNTDSKCYDFFAYGIWQPLSCGACPVLAPVAGTQTAASTEISWSWNAVSGAAGYKFNTVDDYATATDNGTSTSYLQTSLVCNTAYTLYIWAYNNICNSSMTTLTQSTASCPWFCGYAYTDTGDNQAYGTVQIGPQ